MPDWAASLPGPAAPAADPAPGRLTAGVASLDPAPSGPPAGDALDRTSGGPVPRAFGDEHVGTSGATASGAADPSGPAPAPAAQEATPAPPGAEDRPYPGSPYADPPYPQRPHANGGDVRPPSPGAPPPSTPGPPEPGRQDPAWYDVGQPDPAQYASGWHQQPRYEQPRYEQPRPEDAAPYGDPARYDPSGYPPQPVPGQPPRGEPGPERYGPEGYGPTPGRPPTVEELTAHSLLRQRKATPQTGWRKAVYTLSGHSVNPGQSPEDRRRQELVARATVPVRGCHRIAVLSLKGGVGKTTTTVCLGATLASLRGDRVIAVDANPDRGTLSGKIPLETVATVRNLLNDVDSIHHYFDVRRYTSQSPDRLEVLASESDPAVSTAFSEQDYRTVAGVLERFYNVVLTDCGTGLLHSAMSGVLDLADQIVLVSSGSVDGARSASATLDWLEAHGWGDLVRGSVAVINSVRPKSGGVDLDKLQAHFAARCRGVTRIPYDPHLEEGAEVDLGELRAETRDALLELAAHVAGGFPPGGRPALAPGSPTSQDEPSPRVAPERWSSPGESGATLAPPLP